MVKKSEKSELQDRWSNFKGQKLTQISDKFQKNMKFLYIKIVKKIDGKKKWKKRIIG